MSRKEIRNSSQFLDVKGYFAKAEKAEEPATKVHLTPARVGGIYEKASANVYMTTVDDRLRCKQDEAGSGCLDNTFLERFNHGFVTNQLRKALRATNGEADKGHKKIATITGRFPPSGAEGDFKKNGLGLQVCSTKVPETTLKDALVTCEESVSHEITDIKDLKTNQGLAHEVPRCRASRRTDHDAGPQEGSRREPLHLLHLNTSGLDRGSQGPSQEDQGTVHPMDRGC